MYYKTEADKLLSNIKTIEDVLLRSRDFNKKLKLQEDLLRLCIKLQNLQRKDSERTGLR